MKLEDIRHILIVGAGIMGQQVGLQCAMHGYNVTLFDIAPGVLETVRSQLKVYTTQLVTEGRLNREEVDSIFSRITTTSDPKKAAAEADLLSESVPEDPKLKSEIFAQFNQLCPSHTIFTTNTSTLLLPRLAKASGRPALFAALHFHHYVWEANVVDIMPFSGTSQETMELLHAFAKRIGQIPIMLKKRSVGYVFNTMLNALNGAAILLATNGVASVRDIDRAWMGITKMPIGPFGIMDLIGLDTAWYIAKEWANWEKMLDDQQFQAIADFLKEHVDKGQLGAKSGKGFYNHPNPAFLQPGFLTDE